MVVADKAPDTDYDLSGASMHQCPWEDKFRLQDLGAHDDQLAALLPDLISVIQGRAYGAARRNFARPLLIEDCIS